MEVNHILIGEVPVTDDEITLIQAIATEINRDGGCSHVNALPDYDDNKRMPSLLRRLDSLSGPAASRYKRFRSEMKLLTFLECHPDIFQLTDRSTPPHRVKLLPKGEKIVFTSGLGEENNDIVEKAASDLENRLEYVLRARTAKLSRRRQRLEGIANNDLSKNIPEGDIVEAAPVEWLARKCAKELHLYIRLLPERPMGLEIKSEAWFILAISLLLSFLQERKKNYKPMDYENLRSVFSVVERAPENKTSGRKATRFMVNLNGDNTTPSSISVISKKSLPSYHESSLTATLISQVSKRVTFLVHNFSPPVGGMNVGGKILDDQELRRMLVGRDLIKIAQENSEEFQNVEFYQDDERNGEWFVRSRFSQEHNKYTKSIKQENKTLLEVDEVGAYSVTDAKSAMIMAHTLLHFLLKSRISRKMAPQNDKEDSKISPICIDLTSGCGGNTIACAKVFPSVIAFEVDPCRAEILCRNLELRLGNGRCSRHNSEVSPKIKIVSNVEVNCCDSIRGMPEIAARFRSQPSSHAYINLNKVITDSSSTAAALNNEHPPLAAILDPPWGGIHYRLRHRRNERERNAEEDFGLMLYEEDGKQMSLSSAVLHVALYLSPLILGIKLPLTFDVRSFMNRLNRDNTIITPEGKYKSVQFHIVSVKKLGKQLFVVMSV